MSPDPEDRAGEELVQILAGKATLEGTLSIPQNAGGIVMFAHGSGSSRFSPRNRFVAETLREAGLATLLIDLLTSEEESIDLKTHEFRFNIELLAERLVGATHWLQKIEETRDLRIGYFGASTGAGAALIAAAQIGQGVAAVVSRGGRPDLAGEALSRVLAPTLLIVGGQDTAVIELNEAALQRLNAAAEKELTIVSGATHLFEEPGTLEEVARLAADWFTRHLKMPSFS